MYSRDVILFNTNLHLINSEQQVAKPLRSEQHSVRWADNIGKNLIKKVEVKIGNDIVEEEIVSDEE